MRITDIEGVNPEGLKDVSRRTDRPIGLPSIPEPTEVEIELTNICNARCIACPRHALSAPKGFMSEAMFRQIVESYEATREKLAINQLLGKPEYPVITLAGLGEPTLHPELGVFAKIAVQAGFKVILFTNGSKLNQRLVDELVAARIHTIYISFWGIEGSEYRSAMGLDFENSLANVETAARLTRGTDTRLVVGWVRTPVIHSTPEEVAAFWRDRAIEVDMSEYDPWNRGGLLRDPRFKPRFDSYTPVDPSMPIWCSQLYFTDTVTWDGNVVLCSQEYFKRGTVLGHISTTAVADIGRRKKTLLETRPIPEICDLCRKPDRNYRFGSEPWDHILSSEQQRTYIYCQSSRRGA